MLELLVWFLRHRLTISTFQSHRVRRAYIAMKIPEMTDDVQNVWQMVESHKSSIVIVLGEPEQQVEVRQFLTNHI